MGRRRMGRRRMGRRSMMYIPVKVRISLMLILTIAFLSFMIFYFVEELVLSPTNLFVATCFDMLFVLVLFFLWWRPKRKRKLRVSIPKRTRERLLNRGRCENCREFGDVLDIHHIDGNPSNNDGSNLEVLCPNCHASESRRRDYE